MPHSEQKRGFTLSSAGAGVGADSLSATGSDADSAADGFAGNVALKSVEGGVKTVTSTLKAGIKSSFMAKIGALFMKGVLKNMKQRLDVNGQGGAVLLGLKKTVVKVHGSCKASAVVGAVSQVKKMAEFDIATAITSGLAEMPALDFAE